MVDNGPLSVRELIAEVADRLGLEDAQPLTQGGQKIVLSGVLAGAPAVAKIVLVPDGRSGTEVVTRAEREVELLGAVDSPHVVRVLTDAVEVGTKPDAICWAEERLSGNDLSEHLDPQWTEDDTWALLSDVAKGLSACHELEVVHRDLSPGNVRRTIDGRYVLMDPGLARHLEKTALTGVFQPGTAGFMSPEHVPGGKPLPASDVFVLGVLAFRVLTGRLPIEIGGSGDEYFNRLRDAPCPDVAESRPDLSDHLVEVVNQCLHKQPARRFLDGSELVEVINQVKGIEL
ncbi:serine/threonine protein kinase [Rhodococcus fascians]|nr:serine/threonine protein kinase [Rhodococcus fascians]MBY4141311.1 serine/threonine protein kinase [Rhodococcus fascians]MBY4219918.1 serine/threonine protein kinase [Rhodococcus fascians]MBY4225057.1 serine/threonine protein kinase [Rhodococcus fascians]MBY4235180.1 serine/threonine protein kinase [Rhodococcus fascians]